MRSFFFSLPLLISALSIAAPLSFFPHSAPLQETTLFTPAEGGGVASVQELRLSPDQLLLRHSDTRQCSFSQGVLKRGGWKNASYFPTYGLDQQELLWAPVLAWGRPVVDLYFTDGLLMIEGDVPSIDLELSGGYVKLNRLKRSPSELHVFSVPDAALVSLDGEEISPTPLFVGATILPDVMVKVELPGYGVYEELVELKPGRKHRTKVELLEIPQDARRIYPSSTVLSAQGTSSLKEIQKRIITLEAVKAKGRLNAFGEKLLKDLHRRAEVLSQEIYAFFLSATVLEYGRYDGVREVYPVRASISNQGFRFQFDGEIAVPQKERELFESSKEERVDEEATMKLSSRSQKKTYPKRPGQGVRAGTVEIAFRNNTIDVERSGKVEAFYHDIEGMRLLQGGKAWPLRGMIVFPSWFSRAEGWDFSREKLTIHPAYTSIAWRATSPDLLKRQIESLPQEQAREALPAQPVAKKNFWNTSGRYIAYVTGAVLSGYALREHFNAIEKRDNFNPVSTADAQAQEKSINENERRRNGALIGAGVALTLGVVLGQF